MTAAVDTGFHFVNWTSSSQIINPNTLSDTAMVMLTSSDTIIAHFLNPTAVAIVNANQIGLTIYPTLVKTETSIQYNLNEASAVSLKLYSVQGKELGTIVNTEEKKAAGVYVVTLDFSSVHLPAGMYVLNFVAGNYSKSIKLVYAP